MPNNNNKELSHYTENKLSGIYRAVVEDNIDPQQLARVRIRVPMIHGTEGSANYLDTNNLPWATPINPSGSGYDHGSCLIPEVGDIVFVMFEDQDRNYPLYLGGCYGKGGGTKTYGGANDPSTYNGGTWTKPEGLSEIPSEIYNRSGSPTGKVVYKSPKGATIVVEESDGNESIRILDALGQSIRLAGSLTSNANRSNGSRRISSDAYSGKISDLSRISNNAYSEVAITDANGQQIRLLNSDVGSSIGIRSGQYGAGARIMLEKDGARIDHNGNQIYLLDNSSNIMVNGHTIQLSSDGSITLDGSGSIVINKDGSITLNSSGGTIIMNKDGSVSIAGNNDITIAATTVNINSSRCNIRGKLTNYS